MKGRIWRFLSQILFNRRDLINVINPFMQNLDNENINNSKFIPLLQRFPKNELDVLYKKKIISEEIYSSLISRKNESKSFLDSSSIKTDPNSIKETIKRIIREDKINE